MQFVVSSLSKKGIIMATIVTNVSKTVVFQDSNKNCIQVCNFKDGFVYLYMEIKILVTENGAKNIEISNEEELVQFISGCFEEESNFKEVLFEAFNIDENTQFNGFLLPMGEKIEKENSDIWSIEEVLHNVITEYAKKLSEYTENSIKETQEKYDEIIDTIEDIGFECKDESQIQEVKELIENLEEENEEIQIAIIFASYTINLIRKENLEFSQAADKAYEEIERYVFKKITKENLQKTINWLEKYWKYGYEIKEWYINRTMKEFNGFADML